MKLCNKITNVEKKSTLQEGLISRANCQPLQERVVKHVPQPRELRCSAVTPQPGKIIPKPGK